MNALDYPRSDNITCECRVDEQLVSTTIKIVKFVDRTLVFVTNLDRIGHIIEITFPMLYQTLNTQLPGSGRSEHFESRTLLGPDISEYDLLIARIAKIMLSHRQFHRPIWLMLGLDLDLIKNILYLKQIVDTLNNYFANQYR